MKKTLILLASVFFLFSACCPNNDNNKEEKQTEKTLVKETAEPEILGKFKQEALGFEYNALEPFLDARTMEIHYTKHHAGYVKKLNKAIIGTEAEAMTLEEILQNVSKFSDAIRNNAGGHFNHSLFWSILSNKRETKPSGKFAEAISNEFVTLDSLINTVSNSASSQFGSGWAWLIVNNENKLEVCSTRDHDNPLMDIAKVKGKPILVIDVWEHAYYLKFQNKRSDFISENWNVIDWNKVSENYEKALN